eukprot:4498505-Amphidinium_carterae.1
MSLFSFLNLNTISSANCTPEEPRRRQYNTVRKFSQKHSNQRGLHVSNHDTSYKKHAPRHRAARTLSLEEGHYIAVRTTHDNT